MQKIHTGNASTLEAEARGSQVQSNLAAQQERSKRESEKGKEEEEGP